MRDFNFFSPYVDKKKKRSREANTAILVFLLMLLVLVGLNTWQFFRYNAVSTEVNRLTNLIGSEKNLEKVKQLEAKKLELTNINRYLSELKSIDKGIHTEDVINTNVLEQISAVMPKNTTISTMNLTGTEVVIGGGTRLWSEIAEFENNLRGTEIFKRVHIESILEIKENSDYQFFMKCELKDVNASAAQ